MLRTYHSFRIIIEDIIDGSVYEYPSEGLDEIQGNRCLTEDKVVIGHTEAVTVCGMESVSSWDLCYYLSSTQQV